MLKSGKTFQYFNPGGKLDYSFGSSRVAIVADLDGNGYTDVVTFPSTFTTAVDLKPIVWLNKRGKFTPTTDYIKNGEAPQFVRDTIEGDFNGDGYKDWILVDQGWELNNRDPNYMLGAEPVLLTGGKNGLTWNDAESWLSAPNQGKMFNHIGSSSDFDRDGDLDLAIAGLRDGLRVYSNDGTGHFISMPVARKFWGSDHGGTYDSSGVTFVNVSGQTKLAVGSYRMFSENDYKAPPTILSLKNGIWVEEQTLVKPAADSVGRNYGATDMYNKDINGDGREDIVVVWETENRLGIDDGMSDMSGNPQGDRYESIGLADNIVTFYLQNSKGNFELQSNFNNLTGMANAVKLNWEDLNKDGDLDFWFNGTAINPNNINETIFINDGNGVFESIQKIPSKIKFEDWYAASTLLLDANNDGNLDMITFRGIFSEDNSGHLGEEMSVYLNNSSTQYDTVEYDTVESVVPDKDIARISCTFPAIYHFNDGTTWQDSSYVDPYFF